MQEDPVSSRHELPWMSASVLPAAEFADEPVRDPKEDVQQNTVYHPGLETLTVHF